MTYRMTHPSDGLVYACPNCDGTQIFNRADDSPKCYDCGRDILRSELVERLDGRLTTDAASAAAVTIGQTTMADHVEAVLDHLQREAAQQDDPDFYVKAKYIARDTEQEASMVGRALAKLADYPFLEKWGGSTSSTWRVDTAGVLTATDSPPDPSDGEDARQGVGEGRAPVDHDTVQDGGDR